MASCHVATGKFCEVNAAENWARLGPLCHRCCNVTTSKQIKQNHWIELL
jgi:hypothetical protein